MSRRGRNGHRLQVPDPGGAGLSTDALRRGDDPGARGLWCRGIATGWGFRPVAPGRERSDTAPGRTCPGRFSALLVVETVRGVVFTAGTGGRAPRPQVNGFMRSLMLVSERGIDARRRIRLPAGENRRPDRHRPLPAPGLPSGPLRWRWSPRCWRERSSDRGLQPDIGYPRAVRKAASRLGRVIRTRVTGTRRRANASIWQ